ncbi:tyrosine-type recombinase/integrase [Nocardia brevicatena]|uniref:tyrosine-type recombinase/integrase n=1 Tax=Nocardia brevicatena TaxID=37327 RepID=UPI0014614F17|nr:site-specific integrase [Nocardia brevicatena]
MDQQSVRPEVAGLNVARVGRVVATCDRTLPWVVVDGSGSPIGPVSDFLRDLVACGNSPASCRSYGYDLLRWWRFLAAMRVVWDRAERRDVRDFVLWLRTASNPARVRRRQDAPAAGSVNARTGKQYLAEGYAPATINHALSVLAVFYDFHVNAGTGPVVSPVPPQSRNGRRFDAHHNPMDPFPLHRRGLYRQKQPLLEPRAVPDVVLDELFAELDCNRDRALVSMFLSSGARAAELLGMTVSDVHPGEGLIFVATKGLGGIKQACPASPEAFAWLTLYLGELGRRRISAARHRTLVVDQAEAVADIDIYSLAGGARSHQRSNRRERHLARSASHVVSSSDRRSGYQLGRCPTGDASPPDHHDRQLPAAAAR